MRDDMTGGGAGAIGAPWSEACSAWSAALPWVGATESKRIVERRSTCEADLFSCRGVELYSKRRRAKKGQQCAEQARSARCRRIEAERKWGSRTRSRRARCGVCEATRSARQRQRGGSARCVVTDTMRGSWSAGCLVMKTRAVRSGISEAQDSAREIEARRPYAGCR